MPGPGHGPGRGGGFGPGPGGGPGGGFGPPPPRHFGRRPPRRHGCCLPGCCTFVIGAAAIVGGIIALLCAIF